MEKHTRELLCSKCGEIFIYRSKDKAIPSHCSYCRNAMIKTHEQQIAEEKQRLEDEKWLRKSIAEKKCFEEQLQQIPTLPLEELVPQGHTLYVIGNGFDLMHAVQSSYRAFRDFLGKNSELVFTLELYLKPEDIWADFENALGHIDMNMMANPNTVGDMLEFSDFFEDDSGAAEYFMALEMAAEPMRSIAMDLKKQFRAWIETMVIGTADRPLKTLFHDDKVLCFNYTEFVEELYDVSESNVCYIHGCRRKKKGYPKEKLILGHKSGASEIEYTLIDSLKKKKSYRSQVIDMAQEGVVRLLSQYDETLTKDCQTIISAHSNFFESLTDVETIIVIGHSLSLVDWDYFEEITKHTPDAHWYFGCHSIHDLENAQHLADALGIDFTIFRTDNISVAKIPKSEEPPQVPKLKFKNVKSPNGKWTVQWQEKKINIVGNTGQINRILQERIKYCVFSPDGNILFVILDGLDAGIPFFRLVDDTWKYVDEMEPIPNQSLLNRRLQHIYLKEEKIVFVYNNRIREYSLETGALIRNQAKRDARSGQYEGKEIRKLFFPSKR